MPVPSRKWGDGGNDQRVHVIEDISYEDDFIACRCGARLTGIADGDAWTEHGGRVFRADYLEGRESLPEEERMGAVLAAFARTAARCTCATTEVTACPNYLPGDEEVDSHDD
jgi:hypothetical protein